MVIFTAALQRVDPELDEAAEIDGVGWFDRFLATFPASVLMIFFSIWTWNEFFIPLVLLIDNATSTLPVALTSLQVDRLMDAPTINAGSRARTASCGNCSMK